MGLPFKEGIIVKKMYNNIMLLSFFFIALFIVHYVYLSYSPEYTEYMTNNFSLNSKKQTAMLALSYTVFRGVVVCAGAASLYGIFYAMRKRYFFLFAGILCIAIGIIAVYALIMVTPSRDVKNYIHIVVISFFIIILGIVFIYGQYKNKPG